jgi:hypothetical protein
MVLSGEAEGFFDGGDVVFGAIVADGGEELLEFVVEGAGGSGRRRRRGGRDCGHFGC